MGQQHTVQHSNLSTKSMKQSLSTENLCFQTHYHSAIFIVEIYHVKQKMIHFWWVSYDDIKLKTSKWQLL